MRKAIKKFFIVTAVISALYLLVLWTEWLPLSSPAGKKAVAILSAPLPPIAENENAFSETWLFPYDIPEADKAKVMAADIGKFSKNDGSSGYASSAEGKYPKFEDTENLLCKPKTENCLDKARANLDKYHKLFSEHEKLSAKAIALTEFGISRTQFAPDLSTPLANYGPVGSWQLSTAAYWHVQGRKIEAIDLTCRAAGSWRSLAVNSDGLIEQMVGLAFYANASRLFAELLNENPGDLELPSSCAKAYLPVELEKFPICHSMQMEYRLMQRVSASIKTGEVAGDGLTAAKWSDKIAGLWFNKRASDEKFALPLAAECSDDKEILEALNEPVEGVWNGLSLSELAFNPVGGILAAISSPNYGDYRKRMRNLSLTQEAMQAVLTRRSTMAAQAGVDEISSGNKNVRFNKEANAFEVDLYRSPSETQLLSLPLSSSKPASKPAE